MGSRNKRERVLDCGTIKLAISLPDYQLLYIFFSSDGKQLVYLAEEEGKDFVFFNGQEGKRYDGVFQLVFSKDSKYIALMSPYVKTCSVLLKNLRKKRLYLLII